MFLLGMLGTAFAQHAKKLEGAGDQLFAKADYYGASVYYRKAMDHDSTDFGLLYKYAESLRNFNFYSKARYYYLKVYHKDRGRKYPHALFYGAEMYKFEGNYRMSLRYYRRAARYFRGNKSGYEYLKILQEQKSCKVAQKLAREHTDVTLVNDLHTLNTYDAEFGARFFSDTVLYYTSLRSDSVKGNRILDTANYHLKLHEAVKRSDQWVHKGTFDEEINFDGYNIANPAFSPKRHYLYYTVCDAENCQLFRAYRHEDAWMGSEILPKNVNGKGWNNTQPMVTRIDGDDILFFVSDMPGGEGKLDIWYSYVMSNGTYSNPINAGPEINTPGNEICPFYLSEERQLYFSSDWHEGLGGFDIFRAPGFPDKVDTCLNMGQPYNTSVNDMYFSYYNGQGALTSNREGALSNKGKTCCNDVFFFQYEPVPVKKEEEVTNLDRVRALLPLRLYFHNDVPDPGSREQTTSKTYSSTYYDYLTMLPRYQKKYASGLKGDDKMDAQDEIKDLFDDEIQLGFKNLQKAMPLLLEDLRNGRSVSLDVKGYASPLSESEYNHNLTMRRIMAVENYFYEYKGGVFRNYLENGQLRIRKIPFGEHQASPYVSDNIHDQRNSIYSKKAALERRVEIIAAESN